MDALIPASDENNPLAEISRVPVDKIIANPRQPRAHLDPQELAELTASIREFGILQPLIVSHDPERDLYVLIAGERRWRAARDAGLETVPATVRQASAQEQLELALIENVQRSDLTPLEAAEAYRQLTEDFGLSQEEVADRVGKSRVSVTNTLRLLKLPKTVQAALAEGKITEGHARALLGLNTSQAQLAALAAVLAKEMNVRQTEELVRRLSGQRPATAPAKDAQQPEIRALEDRLQEYLGTRVHLRHGPKGGTLVIHYYSDEELNSLIAQIMDE